MFATKFAALRNLCPPTLNLSRVGLSRFLSDNSYQEIRVPVPWGHIAGKWWGATDKRPILALHGWQDNCGSFNRLIPLLNVDVGVLAIDFQGHGYSSRIHSGLYYHFANYLLTIEYIVQHYQWPKVSLMGHSMGALMSFIYGLTYSDNTDMVICLDALKPMIIPKNVLRIPKVIQEFERYDQLERDNREPPSYTMDEIKKRICKPNNNSIEFEHSHHIAERNTAPSKVHPDKYYFTRDPRIKVGELVNWAQKDTLEGAKNATFPIFVGKAMQNTYYEKKENFYEVLDVVRSVSADCHYHRLEGTHHFHLNNPEILAKLLSEFIKKHDIEDRSVGGIQASQSPKCAIENNI